MQCLQDADLQDQGFGVVPLIACATESLRGLPDEGPGLPAKPCALGVRLPNHA